ncbi:MAG: lipocalin-like domain-containing protein [Thioalkalivibrionaceae bacterium]
MKSAGPPSRRVGVFVALRGILGMVVVGVMTFIVGGCGSASDDEARRMIDGDVRSAVTEVMGQAVAPGFDRVTGPRVFRFPEAHGPHRGFRNEWWYFTGHLDEPVEGAVISPERHERLAAGRDGDPLNRAIGAFHLTLFRAELEPLVDFHRRWDVEGQGFLRRWATPEVWMGHAAWIDFSSGTHRAEERYVRGAVGLAGAERDGRRVWIEDWSIESLDAPPVVLRFGIEGDAGDSAPVALTLRLTPERLPVLQGEAGYSRKGEDPSNASLYYSVPRFGIEGEIDRGRGVERVGGTAWLDREWSSSALDEGQVGWDWFSLQLSNGADLMLYQMRRSDGRSDPRSKGRWIAPGAAESREVIRDAVPGAVVGAMSEVTPDNAMASSDVAAVLAAWTTPEGDRHPELGRLLRADDFVLTPLRVARQSSGRSYPVEWLIDLATEVVDSERERGGESVWPGLLPWRVVARFDEQEMTTNIPYFEGSVMVFDAHRSPIGRGFLEMTGYDAVSSTRLESRAFGQD